LILSQFGEQNVPQVVQRFPELDRVHLGMTVDVSLVVPVKIGSSEVEHGNLSAVCFKPDCGKVAAHAQVKRPSEDVRGLKAVFSQ
jgi:hypothetical protein